MIMNDPKMPWFRLYSELLNDKKIDRICREYGYSNALVVGIWVTLLSLANESDDRGKLLISAEIPYDMDDFISITKVDRETLVNIIRGFIQFSMLSKDEGGPYIIKNWDSRQFKSDCSSDRVRKHRESLQAEPGVTFLKRYGNVIDTEAEADTDTESYTEAEEEGKKTPTSAAASAAAFAEKVYCEVTKTASIPAASRADCVQAITNLSRKHPTQAELVSFLTPYWTSWLSCKTKDGMRYSRKNAAWLTDYAVSGQLPGDNGYNAEDHQRNKYTKGKYADAIQS